MKYQVHNVEDNRRYLSTSTGQGNTLEIYTTPISTESADQHLIKLKAKIKEHAELTK
jgi:hypothetical protein